METVERSRVTVDGATLTGATFLQRHAKPPDGVFFDKCRACDPVPQGGGGSVISSFVGL